MRLKRAGLKKVEDICMMNSPEQLTVWEIGGDVYLQVEEGVMCEEKVVEDW